jgi:hypothetical protein
MPDENSSERNSQVENSIPKEDSSEKTHKQDDFLKCIQEVSDAHDADIVYFCGEIDRDYANELIELCQNPHHNNVLLFLTTLGVDPDGAYRIARFLQEKYGKLVIYIDTLCKSAGTLVTLGADEIVMSDTAELGPLDVQVLKTDELNQRDSVLDLMVAFDYLQEFALETLDETLVRLVENSEGQISTKSALDVASYVATNLFSPIYAQISPTNLGNNQRLVQIARKYGDRLDRGNLQVDALELLVIGYPSHSFVIDRQEAQEALFESVRVPTEYEEKLAIYLRQRYKLQDEQTFVVDVTEQFVTDLT